MNPRRVLTIDGNEAVASVAYRTNEVIAIYPITPASAMGELADEWATQQKPNLWGTVPEIAQMQSEGGAAGAVHGALQAGALTTTFTASQGLLLMMPNLYKIAGELTSFCMHVATRTVATHALSIFGDHSDVMACRQTGFALLNSGSVQEAHDLACVAQTATLATRIPFIHCFDGFRTSHEIAKIEELTDADLRAMIDENFIQAHRERALTPDRPVLRGTAQNPDAFFQAREACHPFYTACPDRVQRVMDQFAALTGRQYHLFDYAGHPDADRVIVLMGSGADTVHETVEWLRERGERVGVLKVHLYRPFSVQQFLAALPPTIRALAVLDRTKEPGAVGEPLYLDVVAALHEGRAEGVSRFTEEPTVIGGRYGLSSKEFTPAMVKAVFDELAKARPTRHFTVGITDDVSRTSLPVDPEFDIEPPEVLRAVFFGLGSDGTVGANKNSITIIGDNTELYAQGYFQYDSKKSGGVTISHLRFGKYPIKSEYTLKTVDFVALHKPAYIGRYDILEGLREDGAFLLNSPWKKEEVFEHLTEDMQKTIIEKKIKVYNIDAFKIAQEVGLKNRINTIMQVCFFKISGVLPEDKAIELIKKAIYKSYHKKGEDIVKMNMAAVDRALEALEEVPIPEKITRSAPVSKLIPDEADDFARSVIEPIMRFKGDSIPVSKMPYDGRIPTDTARLEKRGVAELVPRWIPENCIQCNQCSFACPHAAIRPKQIIPDDLKTAPATFTTLQSNTKNDKNLKYRLQVYIEDCVSCGVCVETCPTKKKALVMVPIEKERKAGQNENEKFFESLPDNILDGIRIDTVKGSQFLRPLFEFSGACAGCGETPYIKLVTQLFGERMIIANATGCSSIYGGTFPISPYAKNKEGKGPAWANSLFEDNAEYGFGMRLAVDTIRRQLWQNMNAAIDAGTLAELVEAFQKMKELWNDKGNQARATARKIQEFLPKAIARNDAAKPYLVKIAESQDYFIEKSVWCIGGDGWAYDIGYGGLDHVIAMKRNVNLLVLDTEVYSNTGGQASKATPTGSRAKFASSGKKTVKKDLGRMAMGYGYVYVASVAMGASMNQCLKAFMEAEAYDGPALIIAYSPCINHGIDMSKSQQEEKLAVDTGYWILYRFNPMLAKEGKNPFVLDSKEPKLDYETFLKNEIRYRSVLQDYPEIAKKLFPQAAEEAKKRFEYYKKLAEG